MIEMESNRESVRLAVLPGDGIGPEVVEEALRVTRLALDRGEVDLELRSFPCGGKHYLETGEQWPVDAMDACKTWADATLLGAIGHPGARLPDGDPAGRDVIFGLRFGLDLFANVRPVRMLPGIRHRVGSRFLETWRPDEVDMILVRENTEGAYTPIHGRVDRGGTAELAVDGRVITRKGAERIAHLAFRVAASRFRSGAPADGVRRVICVDKSNVMDGCRLFREVFDEVGCEYPEIERGYAYIDAFCARLIQDPASVDVAVMPNMFGDIASDLASVLGGGLGLAPSANVGHTHGMFESVHGSAPDLVGTGKANPLAEILSAGLMLWWLYFRRKAPALLKASERIRAAVARVIEEGEVRSPDQGGSASCREVGDAVLRALEKVD